MSKRMNATRRAMGGQRASNTIGAKGETRTRLQRAVASRLKRRRHATAPHITGATSVLGVRSPYKSGCRYIHGHPNESNSHWCAKSAASGEPYCATHRALCSLGRPEQRKEAA